jgi:SRSO17 transposase
LLSAEGRKNVEPLAALTAPESTAAQHQSLPHFVAAGPRFDATMLTDVRTQVLPVITREEPIQAFIIDDTSYPRRDAAVLRRARQAGQLLGRG